jgi:MFS family permease
LNAGLAVIAADFGKPIRDITLVSGYQLLVVGASGPFVCAFSRKYGKRPVFLFSSLSALIGTIIGSATNGYSGFLASRVVQGLSASAYESLIIAVIGDLYFVHERGFYMAIIQFFTGAVSNFSSVVCGPITTGLGWKYLFHIFIAFISFQLILLFIFVPETSYSRNRRYEIDELAADDLGGLAAVERKHTTAQRVEQATDVELETIPTKTSVSSAPAPPKKSFRQSLAIVTGTRSSESLFQLVVSPFAVCSNVFIFWVVAITGTKTALYVAVAFDLAQIFSPPPYGLSAAGGGYLSVGPFIGGFLASVLMLFINDPLIKWATRKNKGVYEPEYRLLPMIGGLLTGAGLMGFGVVAQTLGSYYAASTLHGLALFGIIVVAVAGANYVLDAYRDMSSEIFIAAMMFKNFLFYGMSYFINNWTADAGPEQVFYALDGVAFGLTLTTVPVFIYGKRYRSFWNRHNVLEKLHIRTHPEI